MSRESMESLNTLTLIGNTAARGTAWHYRADLQGEEPNHYPGAIPVEDVSRRLFNWTAESRRIAIEQPADEESKTHLRDGQPMRWVVVDGKQAIARSDTNDVFGIFSGDYVVHQYQEWLLKNVANILDDDLTISSAGLLREGAIAWVEVSVPESITTPEGVEFRPNLLATTSLDGSLATTYKRAVTDVVCDNTRAAALREDGQEFKVRHSRRAKLKLGDARKALEMVYTTADAFTEEVAELCRIPVNTATWSRFLDAWVPMTDRAGTPLQGGARSASERKREGIAALYDHDDWVTPWAGTAHGVLQAVNTYEHHGRPARRDRAQRNMLRAVTGNFAATDRAAWKTLQTVLA